MTEQPVLFGPDRALVGIESPGRVDVPTVVILNAGLLHRVGPNRMSVRLASSLADRGIGSFRFDLSGIGDSDTTDTDLLDTERAIADIRSALDHLDARGGTGTYVVAGLCTGAFNAFRMVEQDERVVAVRRWTSLEPDGSILTCGSIVWSVVSATNRPTPHQTTWWCTRTCTCHRENSGNGSLPFSTATSRCC